MLHLPQDRLYQKVAAALAARIDSGEFDASERLPTERRLAEMLSVSRTTVREVLLALELYGIIKIRGGSGSYILNKRPGRTPLEPTLELGASISETLEIRMILETELASRAAVRATADNIAALEAAVDAGWRNFRNKAYQFGADKRDLGEDPDGRFHDEIARAAQNGAGARLVGDLWRALRSPLAEAAENLVQIEQYAELSLLDHDRILAALKAKDPEGARDAMRRHLERYRKIIGFLSDGARALGE